MHLLPLRRLLRLQPFDRVQDSVPGERIAGGETGTTATVLCFHSGYRSESNKTMAQEKLALSERIEAVGEELATLRRCQELGAAEADPAGEELAELERSHAELRDRASQTIKTLEADLQGLSDAVQRWIARQDRKAAKG